MNPTEIILIALCITGVVAIGAPLAVAALLKKGINVQPALDKAQSGLAVAEKVVDGIAELAPATPGVTVVDQIIGWANKAVDAAEQMLKSQQLTADQRKAQAVDMVKSCLTSMGITVTPDLEKVIDGAVEAAVLALPKTGEDVKAAAAAALAPKVQPEATETPAASDVSVPDAPSAPTSAVTIDQLNQAQTIISAAIAEKVAAQVPTECETAAPVTTDAK